MCSLFPTGILGVNRSAHGDIRIRGCFHLCGPGQGVCSGEYVDIFGVLHCVLCVRLRDQLLWKCSSKTPLEPGCTGKPGGVFITV